MKVQGFFSQCFEKAWTSKDGSKSGKSTEGIFVAGPDQFKWENYHDAAWCKEHGIHTGAAGEATIAFGIGDYGYQTVKLLGFKPLEDKPKNEPEQKLVPMEKTAEMVAAAEQKVQEAQNDPKAGTDLPF